MYIICIHDTSFVCISQSAAANTLTQKNNKSTNKNASNITYIKIIHTVN